MSDGEDIVVVLVVGTPADTGCRMLEQLTGGLCGGG